MTAKTKKLYKSQATDILKFLEKFAFDKQEQKYIIDHFAEITDPDPVVKKYDYRCVSCGRLAFRAYLPDSAKVSHRCAKCGTMLTFFSNGKKVEIHHETDKPTKEAIDAPGERDGNSNSPDSRRD